MERLHGTVREGEKVMRAMGNNRSSQEVMDGYKALVQFHQAPHGLKGRTPAEVAGIGLDEPNRWLGLIRKAASRRV